MSTGLTYVNIVDASTALEPQVNGTYVFNTYDEAKQFGEWYSRFLYTQVSGFAPNVYVAIWTSGPNNNGYWTSSPSPSFIVYD